jgi:hypothetical protein
MSETVESILGQFYQRVSPVEKQWMDRILAAHARELEIATLDGQLAVIGALMASQKEHLSPFLTDLLQGTRGGLVRQIAERKGQGVPDAKR